MQKPPLSILVIALSLITLGTLSVTEFLVSWILYDSVQLDISLLLIPVGIGLLRRSEESRGCALLFFGVLMFVISLLVLTETLSFFGALPASIQYQNNLGGFVILGGIAVWVGWRKLRSARVKEWFSGEPVQEDSRPFRFRISALLYLTFLIALICAVYHVEFKYHRAFLKGVSTSHSNGISHCTYVVRKHRWDDSLSFVEYVVIEINSQPGAAIPSAVSSVWSKRRRSQSAELVRPNGEILALPGDQQLYEVRDGQFSSLPGTVTLQQLENYLEDRESVPRIDELQAIADRDEN